MAVSGITEMQRDVKAVINLAGKKYEKNARTIYANQDAFWGANVHIDSCLLLKISIYVQTSHQCKDESLILTFISNRFCILKLTWNWKSKNDQEKNSNHLLRGTCRFNSQYHSLHTHHPIRVLERPVLPVALVHEMLLSYECRCTHDIRLLSHSYIPNHR